MTSWKFFIYFFLFYLSSSCRGQNSLNKEIPSEILSGTIVSKFERDSIKNSIKNGVLLEKYLPLKYSRKGNIDYTARLQKGIDENKVVIFPNFPIQINHLGLTLHSNSVLLFQENSKIILKENPNTHYEILRIHDVENVSVYFANIIGDRYKHTATNGEWGMGISVRGTKNVLLYAPTVKECWGDGIYLGISPNTGNANNENVKIYKGVVNNNRRNGMSIISAQNLKVNKFVAANTFGTSPQAGIDVEPDSNTDIIKNLNFENVSVFNNETHGLLFVLGNLSGKKYDIGTVNVKNFKADTGYLGISFKLANDKEKHHNPTGIINVDNASFSNLSRAEFLSYDENRSNKINVKVKVKNETEEQKIRKQLHNSDRFRVTK
ncbi:hypothetical protein [Cloacibacterium normanense]|uniref:hypothetical protein n=1 Tax=Cloacibacterium normanense TaxID=237258 RepID=UPI0035B3A2B0